ncbi:MAG: hypothetical protein IJ065_01180 [Eubacterium sp.]|nr:hypothetical protein [Eubacterium sp.]
MSKKKTETKRIRKTAKLLLIFAAVLLCVVFYFIFFFARIKIKLKSDSDDLKIISAVCRYNSEDYEDIKISEKTVSNRALGHGEWEYDIVYSDGQESHILHIRYFKTSDRESVNLKVVLEKIEGTNISVKIYKGNTLEIDTSTDYIDWKIFSLGI